MAKNQMLWVTFNSAEFPQTQTIFPVQVYGLAVIVNFRISQGSVAT